MVNDSKFGWGKYDWNKPKCSVFEPTPMNSGWTETLGTSPTSWEKIWNFDRIFLGEQGVHKKNGVWFWVVWGRYDQNKPKCSVFEPAPMNSN